MPIVHPRKIEAAPVVAPVLPVGDVRREYPGFSRSRLYKLSSEGLIEIMKIGTRSVVRRRDIERLVDDAPRLHPRPSVTETA